MKTRISPGGKQLGFWNTKSMEIVRQLCIYYYSIHLLLLESSMVTEYSLCKGNYYYTTLLPFDWFTLNQVSKFVVNFNKVGKATKSKLVKVEVSCFLPWTELLSGFVQIEPIWQMKVTFDEVPQSPKRETPFEINSRKQ